MSDNLDLLSIREDFPGLNQRVYDKPLVYFDNAATSQKPRSVIEEVTNYYSKNCANVHRGAHYLSEIATEKYNKARATVANFVGAKNPHEIIFTRSSTESINLLASCLGKVVFLEGDEIILTQMEHHANIVPWYILAKERRLKLRVANVLDDGTLDLDHFKSLFNKKTRLAAFVHASNALGTINPIKEMTSFAKSQNVITVIDGSQAVHHLHLDLQDLACDFYAFTSHKAYGPTGLGVLYMREEWLDKLPPYQSGGDMILSVSFDEVSFANAPNKFEAGTPNIAGTLGFGEAIRYIEKIGLDNIQAYEKKLHEYALEKLSHIPKVKVIGKAKEKVSVISFIVDGIHPHDISSIFDREGIALRAGHLCTQPLMKRFGVSAFSRASLAFYNTHEEVDRFIHAFDKLFRVFNK